MSYPVVIVVVMEGFDPVGAMVADAQALVGRINADQAALATKTAELLSLWNAGALRAFRMNQPRPGSPSWMARR